MVLLADVRTWSILSGDLGNLISCYIYRNSPRKGSQGRRRWANAGTWKQFVVCVVSASNSSGPLQFAKLGVLLTSNPFHLALIFFPYIFYNTSAFYLKKKKIIAKEEIILLNLWISTCFLKKRSLFHYLAACFLLSFLGGSGNQRTAL